MPRKARVTGEFLHVVARGIGKQILFEDDFDRNYYLSLLKRFKDDLNITILAYCLMENHIHLLLQNPDATISLFMKKIGVCYAGYYNKKYDRPGHLFQNRFKSEVITDSDYLLSAYRYILKNPEKAGIAPADQYRWNSFDDYGKSDRLTDTSLLVTYIGNKKELSLFLKTKDDADHLEDIPPRKDDVWALEVIKRELHVPSGTSIQKMPRPERNAALALLRGKGLSVRQLERLTGINRGVVANASIVK